jgi:hypothetical protein
MFVGEGAFFALNVAFTVTILDFISRMYLAPFDIKLRQYVESYTSSGYSSFIISCCYWLLKPLVLLNLIPLHFARK